LLIEATCLGVVGALAARLFTWMLRICQRLLLERMAGYRPPGIVSEGGSLIQVIGPHGLWLVPLVTTLGGLISGWLVYTFAPEAEGHGTDAVVRAFHGEGSLRGRVAPVKLLASAITIGSGGSAGREGPIALISAAVGSIYAKLARRGEEERRILLLAGMAAGLAAIFRTPMGTGVFAVEVLYDGMDFETGALLYTMLASGVAYAVNGLFVGWQPLFHVAVASAPPLRDYGWFMALGLLAGLAATAVPEVFYRARDAFRALPIPRWIKPGLGGLGVGVIALWLPQVLGGGYGWMQEAMNGTLAVKLMLVLIAAKLVAFALTVSSGGSGGVFAPSLFIGGMLGGSCAAVFHQPTAVFVVVGMAAVFGAAARVPIATMLMVTEMAGGYQLLVPAGCAVMLSYLLQVNLSQRLRYGSLYEAQVPLTEDSPAHYLDHVRVALSLLGRRKLPEAGQLAQAGQVDLLRLLRSRVRLNLPGGRQLLLRQLAPGSRFVGGPIRELYRAGGTSDLEVVAVRRREHVLLPHEDTVLEPNDRLILIASEAALRPLEAALTPLDEVQAAETTGPAQETSQKTTTDMHGSSTHGSARN